MAEEVCKQEIKMDKRGKQQICVDCGRQVIHPERSTTICMDCLVNRIAQAIPSRKKEQFLKGLVLRNPGRPEP